MTLLADYNLPFAAALFFMLLLAIAQAVGVTDMFDGDVSVDTDLDADFDGEVDGVGHAGVIDGLFGFLGLRRVPLTAWLAVFLFFFAAIGYGIQELADSLLGAPLDRWVAAVFAGLGAFPVTGAASRPLAAILPRDETTAVGLDQLVGRRGTITDGVARTGSPARAQVRDHHGHAHYVMVEPHERDSAMHAGDIVLIVSRQDQAFTAVALSERRLAPEN